MKSNHDAIPEKNKNKTHRTLSIDYTFYFNDGKYGLHFN